MSIKHDGVQSGVRQGSWDSQSAHSFSTFSILKTVCILSKQIFGFSWGVFNLFIYATTKTEMQPCVHQSTNFRLACVGLYQATWAHPH